MACEQLPLVPAPQPIDCKMCPIYRACKDPLRHAIRKFNHWYKTPMMNTRSSVEEDFDSVADDLRQMKLF